MSASFNPKQKMRFDDEDQIHFNFGWYTYNIPQDAAKRTNPEGVLMPSEEKEE
jgi:hypothetical protein